MGSARSSLLGLRTRAPRELLDLPVRSLTRRGWRMGALIPSARHAQPRVQSRRRHAVGGSRWRPSGDAASSRPRFSLPHETSGMWPKVCPLSGAATCSRQLFCINMAKQPPPTHEGSLLLVVHLSRLVERRSRAYSFEKAEVELEQDQRDRRQRVAWVSALAVGATLSVQIRRTGKRSQAEAEARLAARRRPDGHRHSVELQSELLR